MWELISKPKRNNLRKTKTTFLIKFNKVEKPVLSIVAMPLNTLYHLLIRTAIFMISVFNQISIFLNKWVYLQSRCCTTMMRNHSGHKSTIMSIIWCLDSQSLLTIGSTIDLHLKTYQYMVNAIKLIIFMKFICKASNLSVDFNKTCITPYEGRFIKT